MAPAILAWVLLTVGSGTLVGLLTAGEIDTWYATLTRPFFAPPNGVFGPVWTALYIMMGIAAGRVWVVAGSSEERSRIMAVYGLQLAANLLWSLLFFGAHQLWLAVGEMVLLLALIVWCQRLFRSVDKAAGLLLWPYLAWVSFALALNVGFAVLNS